MKKHWKPVSVIAALAVLIGGATYYVHDIYLPTRQAEKAEELQQVTQDAEPIAAASTYDYTTRAGGATVRAGSVDENSATADAGDGELFEATLDDGGVVAVANIGSGGGEMPLGEDGAYHGEQPATSDVGAEAAQQEPATEQPSSAPVMAEEQKPGETTKPTDTQPTVTQPTEQPKLSANETGSTTPKDGDRRTVDGQLQEYISWFGWVSVGSGSHSETFESTVDHTIVPNAEF